jgi:UDP-glucose 4-epimerase
MMNFTSALVTGGAGFIGSHLVETLVAGGCRVSVLDNLSSGKPSNLDSVARRIRFIRGDIRDPAALSAAVAGCAVVFHLAAVVSVPKTTEDPLGSAAVNETGSLQVLEAARSGRVRRLVFASSSAVYGDEPTLPKREDMPTRPLTPYAVQKLAVEYYLRVYQSLYGLETAGVRFFNVYGPRQDPSSPYSGVISIFMTQALKGEPPVIYGDGRQSRDFADRRSALSFGHRQGVQRGHGEIRHDRRVVEGGGNSVRLWADTGTWAAAPRRRPPFGGRHRLRAGGAGVRPTGEPRGGSEHDDGLVSDSCRGRDKERTGWLTIKTSL